MGSEPLLELFLRHPGSELPAGGLACFQCLQLQLVSDVVLVDVAHVGDGFLPDAQRGDALHAVEPHVRIEPRPPRLRAQFRDAPGSRIVGGEREQRAIVLVEPRVVHLPVVQVAQIAHSGVDVRLDLGDVAEVEPNIHAGVRYLRHLYDREVNYAGLDEHNRTLFALAAYNAGPGRVAKLRSEARRTGLDPNVWFNSVERIAALRVGQETVAYVRNIYKYYVAYKLQLETLEARKAARRELAPGMPEKKT